MKVYRFILIIENRILNYGATLIIKIFCLNSLAGIKKKYLGLV